MAAGPGQVKQLTGSALDVGLLAATELLPLVVFGLYGGVLADRFDRRLLARWSEAGWAAVAAVSTPRISLCSGGLACVLAVAVLCAVLPGFRDYRAAPRGGDAGPGAPAR